MYSLHVECKFNKSEFWDYYNSILDLTKGNLSKNILDRELSLMLSKAYSIIMRSLPWYCHYEFLKVYLKEFLGLQR